MVTYFLNYFFLVFLLSLAVSNNLILFFIGWVGLNVSLYGILLKGFNSYNIEIILKYFLSGAIVTSLLLLSISFFYLEFFTFNIDIVSYVYLNNDSLLIGDIGLIKISTLQKLFFFIIISVFLFKLGAFPFHFYLGDIYEALDFKKTMFLYTVPLKLVIFLTFLKFLTNFWYLGFSSFDLIMCSGLGSIFISSFTALSQVKLKRFWAYSYLNSIGFTLISVASGIGYSFGELTFYTAKFYFLIYLLTWCGIFEIFISYGTKYRKNIKELYFITDLLYIRSSTSFIKNKSIKNLYFNFLNMNYNVSNSCQFSFFIFLLSLMGLPPTLGFFTKMLVYLDLVSNKNTVFYLVLILFLTPVMAFAYLKIIVYTIYPTKTLKKQWFSSLMKRKKKIPQDMRSKVQRSWVYLKSNKNRIIYLNFFDYAIIILMLPLLLMVFLFINTIKIYQDISNFYNEYISTLFCNNYVLNTSTSNDFLRYFKISQEMYYYDTTNSINFYSYCKTNNLVGLSSNRYWDSLLFFKKITLNVFVEFPRISNFN